jgi:hypothetical protein
MMELLGTLEVAQLAGVSVQAVANWSSRHSDFPKPLARLASGPVWDGKSMRAWLSAKGLIGGRTAPRALSKSFDVGSFYTLDEIRAVLGGETMSYLPQKGSRIVCGRFTVEMNPDAPEVILVGDPPKVQRKAQLLARQGGVLPVFLKSAPGRWQYHGLMEVVEYVTDMQVVGPIAAKAGRASEVVGMLRFRAAQESGG